MEENHTLKNVFSSDLDIPKSKNFQSFSTGFSIPLNHNKTWYLILKTSHSYEFPHE